MIRYSRATIPRRFQGPSPVKVLAVNLPRCIEQVVYHDNACGTTSKPWTWVSNGSRKIPQNLASKDRLVSTASYRAGGPHYVYETDHMISRHVF